MTSRALPLWLVWLTLIATAQTPDSLSITRLFPAANSTIQEERTTVGVEMNSARGGVKVRFEVDGADVTAQTAQRGNLVFWRPSFDLAEGTHSVQVTLTDESGATARESWSFSLKSSRASSITLRWGAVARPTASLKLIEHYPSRSSITNDLRPAVGALLSGAEGGMQVKLVVDDRDVTTQARIDGHRVTWNPGFDLSPGRHTVELEASQQSGTPLHANWDFLVQTEAPERGERIDFTLTVPGSWVEETSNPALALHLSRERSSHFVVIVQPGQGAEASARTLLAERGEAVTGQQPITLDGLQGISLSYERGKVVALGSQGRIFLLFVEPGSAQAGAEAEAMLQSFRVR